MNWLNIEVGTIRRPEYVGSDPEQRATWWNLMAYCAEQENGGVIIGGLNWKCRRWQQTCGVMRVEVEESCDLWSIDGENVVIWGYPSTKESEVKTKRESGSKGGKKRAENAKSKQIPSSASSSASSTIPSSASSFASTEEKGIEEKRIEENSLSDEASESEGFSDDVPTSSVGGMEALAGRICGLRQEWSRIALTYAERQSIIQNAASLYSVSESDWRAIGDYLRATIPEGRPAWQPRSRSKFIETVGDVLNYALEWQRKRTPVPSIAKLFTPVVVTPEARAEVVADFQEIFGRTSA